MLCAVVARAGCRVLLTEDMQDGQRLGELLLANPFQPHNRSLVESLLSPSR